VLHSEQQPDQVEGTEEESPQEPDESASERDHPDPKPPVKLRASGAGDTPKEEIEEFTLPTVQWVAAAEWSGGRAWISFSREANLIQLRDDMPAARSRIQDVLLTHLGIDISIATAAVRAAYEVEAATSVLTILNPPGKSALHRGAGCRRPGADEPHRHARSPLK
jgi:hypothetical protein